MHGINIRLYFFFTLYTGLYICGFSSGSSGAQEIVLKCPRGCKAIRFRVEKKRERHRERRRNQGHGREMKTRDVSAYTESRKKTENQSVHDGDRKSQGVQP